MSRRRRIRLAAPAIIGKVLSLFSHKMRSTNDFDSLIRTRRDDAFKRDNMSVKSSTSVVGGYREDTPNTHLDTPGAHRIAGLISRSFASFALVISKQKRIEAMEIKRESMAKKRPGHILHGMFQMLNDVRLPKNAPPPEPEIRRGGECLRIDFTVLQKSFWIESAGVGVMPFSPQERPDT